MPGTDEELAASLLARIARGDEAALERFYGQFEHRVYAFARSRLGDPHEAGEVLNEVMLEVWRSAHRFAARSKVQTWLLGIAHHKVADRLRRRGGPQTTELDPQVADEGAVTAERALAGAQDAQRLRCCLEQLSDDHRQVVHLGFFEDMPYSEIAVVLEVPVGTVKTRMFHARRALKRCLGAE